MPEKLSQNEVIEKFKKVHGNRFDYSLVKFVNTKTKVKIICKEHGIFEQVPNNHLNGQICKQCAYIENSKNRTKTIEKFIKESNKIHHNKYDYSLVDYKRNNIKVKIICKIHKIIFEQTPDAHINQKSGCPQCKLDKFSIDYRRTKKEFIKNSNIIHENKYRYDLVELSGIRVKSVKIICPKHGIFEQNVNTHLKGSGCLKCSKNFSKCEEKIAKYLTNKKIKYIRQYRFKNCKNKNTLPFDFYLPDYNTCIEFDGIYHYKPFHGKIHFKKCIKRDKIKTKFCVDNNIILVRIPYWDAKNIESILDKI